MLTSFLLFESSKQSSCQLPGERVTVDVTAIEILICGPTHIAIPLCYMCARYLIGLTLVSVAECVHVIIFAAKAFESRMVNCEINPHYGWCSSCRVIIVNRGSNVRDAIVEGGH